MQEFCLQWSIFCSIAIVNYNVYLCDTICLCTYSVTVHDPHPDVCSRSEGELKTPSVSIPQGTIVAVLYTFIVYVLLFILVGATCDR